jgi:hypothetical protein
LLIDSALVRILVVIAVAAGAFALGFGVRSVTESASKKCQPVTAEWTRSSHIIECPAGTVPSVGHGWKLGGSTSAGTGLNDFVYTK